MHNPIIQSILFILSKNGKSKNTQAGESQKTHKQTLFIESYSYSWMVGDHTDQFLQVTERVFISMDGTLYFSYNRKTDATRYSKTIN